LRQLANTIDERQIHAQQQLACFLCQRMQHSSSSVGPSAGSLVDSKGDGSAALREAAAQLSAIPWLWSWQIY
jgi:hypothetical protein